MEMEIGKLESMWKMLGRDAENYYKNEVWLGNTLSVAQLAGATCYQKNDWSLVRKTLITISDVSCISTLFDIYVVTTEKHGLLILTRELKDKYIHLLQQGTSLHTTFLLFENLSFIIYLGEKIDV